MPGACWRRRRCAGSACDAGVIPVVLGGAGEVLDLGRAVRLFTAAQTRRLWLRDRHCTYPGCGMPPQWCDAHHLGHWADGGPSDLANAALLCERHHTIVHTRATPGAWSTTRTDTRGGGTSPSAPTTSTSRSAPPREPA